MIYNYQKSIICALAFLFSHLLTMPTHAIYWVTKSENERPEMFMLDFMIPQPINQIYYAHLGGNVDNSHVKDPSIPKRYFYFYGGYTYAQWGATHEKLNPDHPMTGKQLWSAWPVLPGELLFDVLWHHPGTFGADRGISEGATASIGGFVDTLKPKEWRRSLMRLWYPKDKELAKKYTYWGNWRKNLTTNEWQLLGVIRIPMGYGAFAYNPGGFIEKYGHFEGVGAQAFRNIYTYKKGEWKPSVFMSYSSSALGGYQKTTFNKEGKYATYAVGLKPFPGCITPTIKDVKPIDLGSPSKPPIDPLLLDKKKITAFLVGNELLVEWSFKKKSSPQLRYEIELNSKTGDKRTVFVDHPFQHSHLFHLTEEEAKDLGSVRLTVTDVFDHEQRVFVKVQKLGSDSAIDPAIARQKIIQPESSVLLSDENYSGVQIRYFEKPNAVSVAPREAEKGLFCNWEFLPDAEEQKKLKHVSTFYQQVFNVGEQPRQFGVMGKGLTYLQIEKPGLYRFHLAVSQGGVLKIGNKVVVNGDTGIASVTPVSGWVLLKKGSYPLNIDFFIDGSRPHGMGAFLELEMEGPDMVRQPVPLSMFKLPNKMVPIDLKTIKIETKAGDSSNQFIFKPIYKEENISDLEKIEITEDNGDIWATFTQEDLKSNPSKVVFLPEGDFKLRTRIHLKNNTVINAYSFSVVSKNPPSPDWLIVEPQAPGAIRRFGYLTTKDSVTLMGNKMRWAARRVKGDFVFTMRVKELRNWVTTHRNNYNSPHALVGFIASPAWKMAEYKGGMKIFNWYFDHYFKGRFMTPRLTAFNGLRDDQWRNSHHWIEDPCYFRFSRKGNTFKAEVKPAKDKDAKWHELFTKEEELPDVLYVGPYMNQSNKILHRTFFGVIFDQINIEGNVLPVDQEVQRKQRFLY